MLRESHRYLPFRPGAVAILMAIVAAIASSGCSDDEKITPPTPEDPRKTISGVMRELIDAYEARDIARYTKLFDADTFMFVFDPIDVQENPDIPENWDWPEERSATANLFEAELVEQILLDFVAAPAVAPTEEDLGERLFPEGTMKVVASVDLDVVTRDPSGGENIIYNVDGDQAIFFVYPDSTELVEGVPAWRIFEWRDRHIGSLIAVEIKSWGGIKSLFQ